MLTKVYGLRPLAVTFSHNWFSEVGRYNLENAIEKFGVDHVMFTPSRSLVNRLARKSLVKIGDSCWHCHAGVGAFPLQVAVRWRIPLLIWGESIAEASGRATHREPVLKFDRDYFTSVSAKVYPEAMIGDGIEERELAGFRLPSWEQLEEVGVVGIHLGDYLFWDDERQMEFVRDTYGWREGRVEGTYKGYKSVECRMAGVHDYTKFLKRGFGRGTDHASADVRAGPDDARGGLRARQAPRLGAARRPRLLPRDHGLQRGRVQRHHARAPQRPGRRRPVRRGLRPRAGGAPRRRGGLDAAA